MKILLTRTGCLKRQQRLKEAMEAEGWSGFLTGHARTIYYFTGALFDPQTPAALVIRGNGSILISSATDVLAVDEHIPVENYSITRIIADPCREVGAALRRQRFDGTWGVELSQTSLQLTSGIEFAAICDAGDVVRSLRRRKDEDEIAEIQRSLEFSRVAYQAAQKTIQAGLTEIEVYNAMLKAATEHAGHTLRLAGDFACGLRCVNGGGPPTTNVLREGDLYILDLFPECAFYFGDTCRTFSVGKASSEQQEAWGVVAGTLAMAERTIRPGLPARDFYQWVRAELAKHSMGGSFWHHAGHGVGVHGHDRPRLIPGSNEVIEVGDVIAIEPAIYSESLRGGIRLENTYLVGESGAQSLFDYPYEL